jgi:hypothetical protein
VVFTFDLFRTLLSNVVGRYFFYSEENRIQTMNLKLFL